MSAAPTLADHLAEQLSLAIVDPVRRMIGQYLIDMVDEAGYLTGDLASVAEKLGAPLAEVEAVLAVVQGFDPPGVCARNLTECLAIQLKERDRFDPAMAALVGRLDLLAKRDFAGSAAHLRRRRRGSRRDDRRDPQPQSEARPRLRLDHGAADRARRVSCAPVRTAAYRSSSTPTPCRRSWSTSATTPSCRRTPRADSDKTYLAENLQSATWLMRALDQRAKTILKVAIEIVRQQDAFFVHGVQHLRPLNLKTIADAISMHEFDGFARHRQQIHGDQPRHLRVEIFLHLVDRVVRWRRRPFGGSGALPHQAADRRRERRTTCCRTTPSSSGCARPASTSRGAPWPNTARRCASRPRSSAGGTSWRWSSVTVPSSTDYR